MQFQNSFLSKKILIGASINESNGNLTWHTFSLEADKPEKFEINVSTTPNTWIDFPIICHLKQDHMSKELVINHLADDDEPERTFTFGSTRFVVFLGLGRF